MNTGIEKNSFILYQKPTKGAENSKMFFLDLAKHLLRLKGIRSLLVLLQELMRVTEINSYAVSAICAFIRIQNDCSKSDAKITLFPDEKTSNVMDLDLIKLRQT